MTKEELDAKIEAQILRLKEKERLEAEKQAELERKRVDKLQNEYLKRTGRKEIKP